MPKNTTLQGMLMPKSSDPKISITIRDVMETSDDPNREMAYAFWEEFEIPGRDEDGFRLSEMRPVICKCRSTAERISRNARLCGEADPVQEVEIFKRSLNGKEVFWGPVHVIAPNAEDVLKEQAYEMKERKLQQFKDAGITEDEILEMAKLIRETS